MKLIDWLNTQDMSDAAFGRLIGKSHSTVLRLKRGDIKPSLDTLEAIRSATNGEVNASDFLPPFQPTQNGAQAA